MSIRVTQLDVIKIAAQSILFYLSGLFTSRAEYKLHEVEVHKINMHSKRLITIIALLDLYSSYELQIHRIEISLFPQGESLDLLGYLEKLNQRRNYQGDYRDALVWKRVG